MRETGIEAAGVAMSESSDSSAPLELMASSSTGTLGNDKEWTDTEAGAGASVAEVSVDKSNLEGGDDPMEGLDIDPPPLEEFKKLMESLDDQNDIFEDDTTMAVDDDGDENTPDANGDVWYGNEEEGFYKSPCQWR